MKNGKTDLFHFLFLKMTHNYPDNTYHPVPHSQLGDLTFREYEVLLLIAKDDQNNDISTTTKLSSRTVINMRNRIGDKLLLKGRNKLGQFARQNREALTHWFTVFFPPRK